MKKRRIRSNPSQIKLNGVLYDVVSVEAASNLPSLRKEWDSRGIKEMLGLKRPHGGRVYVAYRFKNGRISMASRL